MTRKKLREQLSIMADDIQIGGDVNFRSMAVALDRAQANGTLTQKHTAHMTRLLRQGERFLGKLSDFWEAHPDLDKLVDHGEVCASELGKNQT